MNVKIITLGTSHGDPTYSRFNSSTVFEIKNALYLIDAGAPVNALMIRHGLTLRNLKSIFITHMHEDHVGGLPGMIKSLVKYPQTGQHTDVFLPETTAINALMGWMKAMHRMWDDKLLMFKTTKPGLIFSDENIQVSALTTKHLENEQQSFPSFAYQFDIGDKKIIHTGDLKHDFSDFPVVAMKNPSDLCICECTHFDMSVAKRILSKCLAKRMIFNHVADSWHGDGEKKFLEIIKDLPFPCVIAHDGDKFEI
jgi:ribonuclease BN (tRNA processing enzyme)